MQQRILTTGDVAKFCGVTYRTVLRWIDRGTLVAYQLPGRGDHRIRIADFLNFLSTHKLPVPEEFAPSSSRVMILDGHDLSADHLTQLLSDHGFEVARAHDGFHAGTLLNSFQPAVIIMDDALPCVRCGDLLGHLRTSDICQQTKTLILIDEADDATRRAIEQGADDVLQKPFSDAQLLQRLRALLTFSGVYAQPTGAFAGH